MRGVRGERSVELGLWLVEHRHMDSSDCSGGDRERGGELLGWTGRDEGTGHRLRRDRGQRRRERGVTGVVMRVHWV